MLTFTVNSLIFITVEWRVTNKNLIVQFIHTYDNKSLESWMNVCENICLKKWLEKRVMLGANLMSGGSYSSVMEPSLLNAWTPHCFNLDVGTSRSNWLDVKRSSWCGDVKTLTYTKPPDHMQSHKEQIQHDLIMIPSCKFMSVQFSKPPSHRLFI